MKIRLSGRVFLSGIIIAGLAGLFAGPAAAADTIKLGVAGSHSGDLAS